MLMAVLETLRAVPRRPVRSQQPSRPICRSALAGHVMGVWCVRVPALALSAAREDYDRP
jgi:hypothetical protein